MAEIASVSVYPASRRRVCLCHSRYRSGEGSRLCRRLSGQGICQPGLLPFLSHDSQISRILEQPGDLVSSQVLIFPNCQQDFLLRCQFLSWCLHKSSLPFGVVRLGNAANSLSSHSDSLTRRWMGRRCLLGCPVHQGFQLLFCSPCGCFPAVCVVLALLQNWALPVLSPCW